MMRNGVLMKIDVVCLRFSPSHVNLCRCAAQKHKSYIKNIYFSFCNIFFVSNPFSEWKKESGDMNRRMENGKLCLGLMSKEIQQCVRAFVCRTWVKVILRRKLRFTNKKAKKNPFSINSQGKLRDYPFFSSAYALNFEISGEGFW